VRIEGLAGDQVHADLFIELQGQDTSSTVTSFP